MQNLPSQPSVCLGKNTSINTIDFLKCSDLCCDSLWQALLKIPAGSLRNVHHCMILHSTNFLSAESLRNFGVTSDNGLRNAGRRSTKSHSSGAVIFLCDSKYFW